MARFIRSFSPSISGAPERLTSERALVNFVTMSEVIVAYRLAGFNRKNLDWAFSGNQGSYRRKRPSGRTSFATQETVTEAAFR